MEVSAHVSLWLGKMDVSSYSAQRQLVVCSLAEFSLIGPSVTVVRHTVLSVAVSDCEQKL